MSNLPKYNILYLLMHELTLMLFGIRCWRTCYRVLYQKTRPSVNDWRAFSFSGVSPLNPDKRATLDPYSARRRGRKDRETPVFYQKSISPRHEVKDCPTYVSVLFLDFIPALNGQICDVLTHVRENVWISAAYHLC